MAHVCVIARGTRWHDNCTVIGMSTIPAQPTEAGQAARARIVVADDDLDTRELVSDFLREEGYDVQEVANGSELLVRVEDSFVGGPGATPVSLFITDIHMPGYMGTEVVEGLRQAGLKTPVIVMTALGVEQARRHTESLDAAFLCKPFNREQLLTLVRAALLEAPPPGTER